MMAVVIDTPENIEAYRLLSMLGRCRLEAAGIRFRINTCEHVRKEFGITKRRRADVVAEFERILRDRGVLVAK